MKQEWSSYLNEIEIVSRYVDIIEKKIEEVSVLFDEEIERIFVSNIRKEEQVEFISLWLFSNNKLFECKNFISKEDYDVLIYKNKVSYINITKSNYSDFDNPSQDSTLNAVCYINGTNMSCLFNAVGSNAKYLLKLIKEIFLPNVV